ncbi:hypothetical protein BJ165DRAFT_1615193 [Panaeolus papilionaceus]|nr:hypothetical protein BJ165DRAFT_1615193 [Panaeolus papilionaceus]
MSSPHPLLAASASSYDLYNHEHSRPELDLRCSADLGVTRARVEEVHANLSGLPPPSNIRFDFIQVSDGECHINLSITTEELCDALQPTVGPGAAFTTHKVHPETFPLSNKRDIDQSQRPDSRPPKPSIKLIFVEDPNYGDEEFDHNTPSPSHSRPRLNATAIWLHLKLGLPMTFFDQLSPTLDFRWSGNSCFTKHDEAGKLVFLEGFYQNSHGLGTGPAYVYYAYSLRDPRTTTYVIYNITRSSRDIIVRCAQTQPSHVLLRPLIIDVFLADDLLKMWYQRIGVLRSKLIVYVGVISLSITPKVFGVALITECFSLKQESEVVISNFSMAQSTKVLQDLHSISQDLQIVRGNLLDLRDKIQYFLHIRQSYLNFPSSEFHPGQQNAHTSIAESLALLGNRIDVTGRWAGNYYERASIRINLFFNLTTQADSHTNLSIARMTTKISVATQKDSSSMITFVRHSR